MRSLDAESGCGVWLALDPSAKTFRPQDPTRFRVFDRDPGSFCPAPRRPSVVLPARARAHRGQTAVRLCLLTSLL